MNKGACAYVRYLSRPARPAQPRPARPPVLLFSFGMGNRALKLPSMTTDHIFIIYISARLYYSLCANQVDETTGCMRMCSVLHCWDDDAEELRGAGQLASTEGFSLRRIESRFRMNLDMPSDFVFPHSPDTCPCHLQVQPSPLRSERKCYQSILLFCPDGGARVQFLSRNLNIKPEGAQVETEHAGGTDSPPDFQALKMPNLEPENPW